MNGSNIGLPFPPLLVALLGIALLAWLLVGAVRRYALHRLLDVPGDRSSHSTPTPRGGGLGLAVAHSLAISVAGALGYIPFALVMALIVGGTVIAAVGFLDDHGHVPAGRRLSCHALAFVWAFAWLGGMPPVEFGWGPVDLGLVWTAATLFYLTWFLNLFNFMDGIDGIAGVQAISMAVVAAVLLCIGPGSVASALPSAILAAATAGFLAWNWPPARIFMGDIGSGYLGYALGTTALATVVAGQISVWVWLILGGAFVADASVTLFTRIARRDQLSDAHRSHAYQRLSRRWSNHRSVTLLFLAINLIWLAPLAWLASDSPALGGILTLVAWTPLFVAAWWLGAGKPGDIVW